MIAPPVLALNGIALLELGLLAVAAGFALEVLRHWDITSGSERQLRLERRTYLISTLVAWCFISELLSLLLFVYTAEWLAPQFVGAMCATGVLNAAPPWGWATLWLKIVLFFAGAVWLLLNRIDHQAPDYPLVRVKYALLLGLLPLAVAGGWMQGRFFLGLDPDVIVSCCGALFTSAGRGLAAEVSALDARASLAALYLGGLALAVSGGYFLWRGRGGGLFALLAVGVFVLSLVAMVSAIALYVYEHPHHHCPFCLLKSGHGFIGYGLYGPLFIAMALALGQGVIGRWRHWPSLRAPMVAERRRLAAVALALFGGWYLLATAAILRSSLRLFGTGS